MPLLGAVLAITLSLKDYPASVQTDAEFSLTASLECSKCGDSYVRAVFFPSGSRYFGFTQNNAGDWISTTDDKTKYFQITPDQISAGTWSGQLRVRSDSASGDYQGPGDYFFKLIRYTASGSKSTESDQVLITINGPSPTPIPPTHSPVQPTPLPTASPVIPTSKPSPIRTITDIPAVLGLTVAPSNFSPVIPTSVPTPQSDASPGSHPIQIIAAWIFIILSAFGLLTSALFYFWRKVYTRIS